MHNQPNKCPFCNQIFELPQTYKLNQAYDSSCNCGVLLKCVSRDDIERQTEQTRLTAAVSGDVRQIKNFQTAPNAKNSITVIFWRRRGMRTTKRWSGGNYNRPLPDTHPDVG